jgi:hypothetical protein
MQIGLGDRRLMKVVTYERAGRERFRHQERREADTATDVGHLGAVFEFLHSAL